MNALTAEWIEKAEGDFVSANRELRARRHPNYDAACFHAQQAVEKYLKAFLQEHNVVFPRTHNLVELLELCLLVDGSFELQRVHLTLLDPYAVRYRYPGESADKADAQTALTAAKVVREFMRPKFGPTPRAH
jgi:HEPN domain-containing protein